MRIAKAFIKKYLNISFATTALLILVTAGGVLRFYYMFAKEIFTDEIFYTQTALQSSLLSVFTSNDWLKDHGFLYLIFLKLLEGITSNIILLRTTNLLIYLIICISLYYFLKKHMGNIVALVPIFLFSFLPYFVFLNTYISPYNFVLFFSVLSFISLTDFIFSSQTKNKKIRNSVFFLVFSTLAFYSDYSVVYFYLSIIPIVLLYSFWNEKIAEELSLLAFGNLLTVSPGLYVLANNFRHFSALNDPVTKLPFSNFLNLLASIIFTDTFYPVTVFIIFILFLGFVAFKERIILLKYLSFFAASGFLLSLLFLYYFNNSFFYILEERTFWFFYFLLILGLTVVGWVFKEHTKVLVLLLVVLSLFIFIKYNDLNTANGIFGKNIAYKNLVLSLMSDKTPKMKSMLIIADDNYESNVLTSYYFNGLDTFSRNDMKKRQNFFRFRPMKYVTSDGKIPVLKGLNEAVIINFKDEGFLAKIKDNLNTLRRQKKLSVSFIYYQLKCFDSYCAFIKE